MTRTGAPPVAYVVSIFPCWSETFIVREIQALRARGIRIRIFSLKPPRETLVQAEARPLLNEVIYPRPGRLLLSLLRRPAAWFAAAWTACREAAPRGPREVAKAFYTVAVAADFAQVARRLGVRHLHAHFATYPGLAVRTIHELTGIPCSITTHAHDIFLPNPYLLANARAARTVVTISEYNRQHLQALGAPTANVKVVPSGLDVENFHPLNACARTPGAIVAIGRLTPIKGFGDLVEACALLRDRGVKFTCDVIGAGPLFADLERLIAAHDLRECVRLLGALDQKEVQHHLSRAEVCVVPSVRAPDGDQDGIPAVLMEAMAFEVPVVTTRLSGIPELVVDSRSGLLVEPRDVQGLATAMERLLGDPRLRQRLAVAARAAVQERQDMPRAAARMHQIFRGAIGGRRGVAGK